MITLEEITESLSPQIKKLGFRKNRLNWYKDKNKITLFFAIQKSIYSSNTWFYWFGVCLNDIAEYQGKTINNCQIRYRVDSVMNGTEFKLDNLIQLIRRWEAMYGDLNLLRICAIEGKLPGQYTTKAVSYLSSIDIAKL